MLVAAIIIEQYPCAVNAADVDTAFLSGEDEGVNDYSDTIETNDGAGEDSDDYFSSDLDESFEVSTSNQTDATVVSEIVESRDVYSKEFIMSDDTTSIVMYSEPVHYQAEDGSFVEIDNSLVETEEGYENADNTYHVVFTDGEESQGEVRFEEDDYRLLKVVVKSMATLFL